MLYIVKIKRKKTIFDVLNSKQAFVNNENIGFKTHKIGIFPKGLVNGFGQKFEILTFRCMQNTPRKSNWWRSR